MTYELVSHALCPYVQRCAIVLAEKGVSFRRTVVDLADKPAWFVRISPTGKVPLLRLDGEVLFESAVICEYLDETLAPRLHPEDPLARARERAFVELASSILGDVWGYETAKDEATLRAKGAVIAKKLAHVEDALSRRSRGDFFRGEAFGIVDAAFAPVFRYFEVFDRILDVGVLEGVPRVRAWRDALRVRPSVIGAAPADYADRLLVFLADHDAFLHHARAEA